MFTEKAQAVVDLAKDYAFSSGSSQLDLQAFVTAMVSGVETCILLADGLGVSQQTLRDAVPYNPPPTACPGRLPLAESAHFMLGAAQELSETVPDSSRPGLIDIRHIACALGMSPEACAILGQQSASRDDLVRLLASWYEESQVGPTLGDLVDRLRRMRSDLLARVFGQDHAIYAFVEALFNAEIVAQSDRKRRTPRAVFVFAGPPGVGKTYLAELGALYLERPFKRFDMSAYSGHQQNEALVGMGRSYVGAHAGLLTEFVEKNPDAVLLFDEIEKAHSNTIHLFLQILDAGTLEDKHTERTVAFKDTTIIFTTNAGRKLYDRPEASGVRSANSAFHRKTILDALETERDPETRLPFFPPAICSRLATGYPTLFNHLGVNELESVTRAEISRISDLIERQFFKRVSADELLPICLVLREGARTDARTVRSQAEAFVKSELFAFCQLFDTDKLEEAFVHVDEVRFTVDPEYQDSPEIRQLFESEEKPRVLVVSGEEQVCLFSDHIGEIDWLCASTPEDALQKLGHTEVDLVLVDLWMGRRQILRTETSMHFDHVPASSRRLDQGQELLQQIHMRMPGLPVYLLSLDDPDDGLDQSSIDEELFMACVRGGGARGMISTGFIGADVPGWECRRDELCEDLLHTCRRLYREKSAQRMGMERKVLSFDATPSFRPEQGLVTIRLRNLRLARALAAADAGEVMADVERPKTRFEDVIGADAAKEELQLFIDYLRNPKHFTMAGLKPPKGVLLHGPPGTGKTMLARAMAGESNVAFIAASASSFVTIWQGSGPQSVRDLFERARRYAPSIVFIDEIDAVGKARTGMAGGHAEENTLNALLVEIDGFSEVSTDRPVFVLAATNFEVGKEGGGRESRSRELDPALVRRFSRSILVDLPDRSAREKYLNLRLIGRPSCQVTDAGVKVVGERTSGMSIARLEEIIEFASRRAFRDGGCITDEILLEALETSMFGEVRARDPKTVLRTARHEAGHTIMYWLSGWWPVYTTVVSRGDFGGYMEPCADEVENGRRTREELRHYIRVCMGGRAAEMLYYGDEAGLSVGASRDLEMASKVARDMVCRYGMDDEFGLLVTKDLLDYEGALSSPVYLKVNKAAGKILNEQMEATRRLLGENREHLEAVAQALVARERLTREELKAILPDVRKPPI